MIVYAFKKSSLLVLENTTQQQSPKLVFKMIYKTVYKGCGTVK